jgi:hypothetical protein
MDDIQVVKGEMREVRWGNGAGAWMVRKSEVDGSAMLSRAEATFVFPADELADLQSALQLLQRRGPPSQGRPWTAEADADLAAAFEGGEAVTSLAERMGRTRGAITARLIKLGKLEDDGSRRWPLRG